MQGDQLLKVSASENVQLILTAPLCRGSLWHRTSMTILEGKHAVCVSKEMHVVLVQTNSSAAVFFLSKIQLTHRSCERKVMAANGVNNDRVKDVMGRALIYRCCFCLKTMKQHYHQT